MLSDVRKRIQKQFDVFVVFKGAIVFDRDLLLITGTKMTNRGLPGQNFYRIKDDFK